MDKQTIKDLLTQALEEFSISELDDIYEEVVLNYMEKENEDV